MRLSAGDKLGPYEILRPIGAGGMGEVYRARDSRLGREVAIKTLHGKHGDRFLPAVRGARYPERRSNCPIRRVSPTAIGISRQRPVGH